MERNTSRLAVALAACLLVPTALSKETNKQTADQVAPPEAATGISQQHQVIGKEWMIASANPYASEAGGAAMLRQGGQCH